jgi:DNA mismatch endonuclease (patch repair protein)
MTDTLTRTERSAQMSLVRGKNTKPELAVRKIVYRLGYRYRLHGRALPGRPDITLARRKKVIFVHGCFWHRHPGCRNNRLPKSRLSFWFPKLESNRKRDLSNQARLRKLGLRYLVVWECEIRKLERLVARIERFLGS